MSQLSIAFVIKWTYSLARECYALWIILLLHVSSVFHEILQILNQSILEYLLI